MKTVHVKSAMPVYIAAAVWLLAGLAAPGFLLTVPGLVLTAALSAGAGVASRRFFPGRDVEVEAPVDTGDAGLDEAIRQGRARLAGLAGAGRELGDGRVSRAISRMGVAGEQIFGELARAPEKAGQVRRFMSYYLPTAEKLVDAYRRLSATATRGENIRSAMGRIEESMDLAAAAFEKCADRMFADTELDVDAEIQVLRTMLAGDDLLDGAAAQPAATAEQGAGRTMTLGGQ